MADYKFFRVTLKRIGVVQGTVYEQYEKYIDTDINQSIISSSCSKSEIK